MSQLEHEIALAATTEAADVAEVVAEIVAEDAVAEAVEENEEVTQWQLMTNEIRTCLAESEARIQAGVTAQVAALLQGTGALPTAEAIEEMTEEVAEELSSESDENQPPNGEVAEVELDPLQVAPVEAEPESAAGRRRVRGLGKRR